MPLLDRTPTDDLLVVGYNGSADKACGQSLPIVRHAPSGTGCVLNLKHGRLGPWDSWEVVKAHATAGDLTLFPEDKWVPFPVEFAATPPPGKLLVLAAPLSLLKFVYEFPRDEKPGWRADYNDWVWVTPDGPVARVASEATNAATMDGWTRRLNGHVETALGAGDWTTARTVGELAVSAARDQGVSYLAEVRHLASYYFDPAEPSERAAELFRLFVLPQFPTETWERFRDQMTVVQRGAADRRIAAEQTKKGIAESEKAVRECVAALRRALDLEQEAALQLARQELLLVRVNANQYWSDRGQSQLEPIRRHS